MACRTCKYFPYVCTSSIILKSCFKITTILSIFSCITWSSFRFPWMIRTPFSSKLSHHCWQALKNGSNYTHPPSLLSSVAFNVSSGCLGSKGPTNSAKYPFKILFFFQSVINYGPSYSKLLNTSFIPIVTMNLVVSNVGFPRITSLIW